MEKDPASRAFSANRLGGEPLPEDLRILLAHSEELAERTGIELNTEEGWAPWLDTSYLNDDDRANPDTMANVRAIADVCRLVAFVGATEDGESFGYWRGPDGAPVAVAPIVVLDTEGQFRILGSSFAEAVLFQTYGEESFAEMRDWLRSLGIEVRVASIGEIPTPAAEPHPADLHHELYRRYLGASREV